jgi:NAD(P)-dependent dehydrogenase (short-subunit alcohol dehydrogenase family)
MNGAAAEAMAEEIGGPSGERRRPLALRLDVINAAETDKVFDAAIARLRRARHRLRQCRRLHHEPRCRSHGEGVGFQHGRERQGHLPDQPGSRAALPGREGAGRDRQYRVDGTARRARAALAHYCASKFAVVGFTQSLAKEVGATASA